MSDPNPVVVDPTPDLPPVPAPERLLLAESFPLCFNWERPQPLKIDIHKDLVAGGPRPGGRPARAGPLLQSRPVPENAASGRAPDRPARPTRWGRHRTRSRARPDGPDAPRRLRHRYPHRPAAQRYSPAEGDPRARSPRTHREILGTAPTPPGSGRPEDRRPDRGGDRHRDPAAEGLAHAGTGGQGLSAVGGRVERVAGAVRRRRDRLKHPALQVFEKKARPEAAAEGEGPEPNGPAVKAPEPKASEPKAPDSNGPAVEAPEPKASEPKAPEVNASAVKKPEGKASAVKAPDRKTPAAPPPAPPFPKLSLKGRGATQGA